MPTTASSGDLFEDLPEPLLDTSPGAKLVYLAVVREWPTETADVADTTGMAVSSVREAIRILDDRGWIRILPHPTDGRRRRYIPTDPDSREVR